MKQFLFKSILSLVAFLAIAQSATAQWTGTPNPTTPTIIYNNNPYVSKVGIGTTTPTQKLQIQRGNVLLDYANGIGGGSNLYLGGLTNSSQNGMRLSFYNSTGTGFKNGYIDVHTFGGTANDGLLFRVDAGATGIGGIERMRIRADNGNVGIGTAALGIAGPGHRLHVHDGAVMISGKNAGGGPMLLFSKDPSLSQYPAGHWGIEYVPHATNPALSGLNFWQPWGNSGTPAGSPGNYYLFLRDKDGKVGMGINPADNCPNGPFPGNYGLYVKGGILTEKVKVANYCSANWADYVFAPDYQLKPLAEVEAFVKANKHLPNVPSAQDIEKDGLDVADMLSKQMEKIEELMLHTIALNKRVKKLEAENAALQQQVTTPPKY